VFQNLAPGLYSLQVIRNEYARTILRPACPRRPRIGDTPVRRSVSEQHRHLPDACGKHRRCHPRFRRPRADWRAHSAPACVIHCERRAHIPCGSHRQNQRPRRVPPSTGLLLGVTTSAPARLPGRTVR
jgi:hypothetical protein